MKSSTLRWIVLVLVVIVGLGWWWYAKAPAPAPAAVGSSTSSGSDQGQQGSAVQLSTTVTYDGNAFSPSTLTVAVGSTVTFTDTAGQMWVASDPHPTHTSYDGTDRSTHCAVGYSGPTPFDECAAGPSYTFTFTKAGSFGYHDHLNDGAQGTIVVQ